MKEHTAKSTVYKEKHMQILRTKRNMKNIYLHSTTRDGTAHRYHADDTEDQTSQKSKISEINAR